MSDFIYCPICDRRIGIDEASYVSHLESEIKKRCETRGLSSGDMICVECEIELEAK